MLSINLLLCPHTGTHSVVPVDYKNWEASLAQQQEQQQLKRGLEDDGQDGEGSAGGKRRPTKKELALYKEKSKERKEKKQKGWLMSG